MKPKINPVWGYITLALVILSLTLCIVGAKKGTLAVRTDDDPKATVERFFESVVIGKYDEAYDCLANYDSLGLENRSDNQKWNALLASFDYTLLGEPRVQGATAEQTVQLRYLDVNALEEALMTPLNDQSAPAEGEEGEQSQPVFPRTEELLARPEAFYVTAELQITLQFKDGQWRIVADEALLNALSGGKYEVTQ